MQTEGNKALLRQLQHALNKGDLDAIDDIFTPGYIRHDPSGLLNEVGVERYKQTFGMIRRAFPDAHWTLEEVLEDGDRVIGRWTFHGTHTGPFANLAPTGREVTYPIIAIYRIENGRIAEDWHVFHALGLWQTLIPEIAERIAKARG
jgi:predicted ester cyclase